MRTRTVAVAGKGGTGKTTLTGLIVRALLARGQTPLLAVDADPNANLGEILGAEAALTVGRVREAAFTGGSRDIPEGWDKQSWIEYRMHEAVAEARGFDMLVMGRPEGPGCYCYANNLLREYIKGLAKDYAWVVMDNEGGLEHLSRHTTRDVDVMFVTSDPSIRGMRTVTRINQLIDELGLVVAKRYLVVGRVPDGFDVSGLVAQQPLELAATVPEDTMLFQSDVLGRDLFALPADAPALRAVEALVDRFLLDGAD
jgi:CO dehydrogenase maturation factor